MTLPTPTYCDIADKFSLAAAEDHGNYAKNNPYSTFGCNYVNSLTNYIHEYSNIMPDDKLHINTVRELIEIKDGRKVITGLDMTDLLDLLECVVYRIVPMYSLFRSFLF